MEVLSGHLPSAQPEECSNTNPDPKAGGDSAPPGEQAEMEAKRSKEGKMVGTWEPDRQGESPGQASHSSRDTLPQSTAVACPPREKLKFCF